MKTQVFFSSLCISEGYGVDFATLGPNLAGPNGCGDRGCDNGTLGMAWGSGTANFPYLVTPDSALQAQAIADGTIYQSILGKQIFRDNLYIRFGSNHQS